MNMSNGDYLIILWCFLIQIVKDMTIWLNKIILSL